MRQPEKHPYDRSSKWLIQHQGDSMLRLAQIQDIDDWRPAQAEVVQPRQLPDELLEARLRGQSTYVNFLLEVATYADGRIQDQLTRDAMLVYLDRGQLPEVVVFVLAQKGKRRIPGGRRLKSRYGLTSASIKWRVVELWDIPAEALLNMGDVGLVPWVMRADSSDPPEALAQRCRDAIDRHAPTGEKENLLAVVQVLDLAAPASGHLPPASNPKKDMGLAMLGVLIFVALPGLFRSGRRHAGRRNSSGTVDRGPGRSTNR